MTNIDGDFQRFGSIADVIVQALSQPRMRFPVLRTKYTEERRPISQSDRIYVYARDHFSCVRCGRERPLVLDHFQTWSALGPDHVDNLRTLCEPCNKDRSNFTSPDDVTWRPLPVTYLCIFCDPTLDRSDPSVGPAFCYWHRLATVGSRENY